MVDLLFEGDGTYQYAANFLDGTKRTAEGTYRVEGNTIICKAQDGSVAKYHFEFDNEGNLILNMPELGGKMKLQFVE